MSELTTSPAAPTLREALNKAVDAVLAYGAAPPEYPTLALVPQSDIQRLRRIRTAIRVADHSPHDQSGEPVEGFPTCSTCGAIQTDAALARADDGLVCSLCLFVGDSEDPTPVTIMNGNLTCEPHSGYFQGSGHVQAMIAWKREHHARLRGEQE